MLKHQSQEITMPVRATATYRTHDFAEICFLMANEIVIVGTERVGERVSFVFDDSNGQCGAYVHDFLLGRDQASTSRILAERQRAMRIIKAT
jgi:hypothetical protein